MKRLDGESDPLLLAHLKNTLEAAAMDESTVELVMTDFDRKLLLAGLELSQARLQHSADPPLWMLAELRHLRSRLCSEIEYPLSMEIRVSRAQLQGLSVGLALYIRQSQMSSSQLPAGACRLQRHLAYLLASLDQTRLSGSFEGNLDPSSVEAITELQMLGRRVEGLCRSLTGPDMVFQGPLVTPGTWVDVTMPWAGIHARAEVCYEHPSRYMLGLRFLDLTRAHRERVASATSAFGCAPAEPPRLT